MSESLHPSESNALRWANADARTLAIVRSSGLVRMIDRLLATVIVALRNSAVAAWSRQVFDRGGGRPWPDRVRLASAATMVASATVLVLQRLALPPAPRTWIVPALMLVAGVCLFALTRNRAERQS
jgi:hypothetical protein